jgi:hypothetical protein
LAGCLVLDKVFRRLRGVVNVLTEVVRGRQLEEIGVKSWHFRLDVVKQVSLLHMAAVDLDWHLLEQLR